MATLLSDAFADPMYTHQTFPPHYANEDDISHLDHSTIENNIIPHYDPYDPYDAFTEPPRPMTEIIRKKPSPQTGGGPKPDNFDELIEEYAIKVENPFVHLKRFALSLAHMLQPYGQLIIMIWLFVLTVMWFVVSPLSAVKG